jgi:hypothetical protein
MYAPYWIPLCRMSSKKYTDKKETLGAWVWVKNCAKPCKNVYMDVLKLGYRFFPAGVMRPNR